MTKYYLIKTENYNKVIATDNNQMYMCPVNDRGIDINSNVDLYGEDEERTLTNLRNEYAKMVEDGILYNMDDIELDFANEVMPYEECWEEMIEIAEVE